MFFWWEGERVGVARVAGHLYGGSAFPRRHPASAGRNGNIDAIAIDQIYSR